jgi:two-component system OmpR family sensor kinase
MLAGRRLMVGAGEPLASVEQAERSILRSFLLAGVFIVLFVVVGSYLIGTGITAPLRRMARVAATIDAGDLRPRVQPGRHDEIGVLANAFNHMVDRLDRAFRRQREFVADASHELRTPITVIQGQLEVLADCPDPSQDDVRRVERIVRRETHRMRRMVDDLLLLAQAERFDFLALSSIQVRSFLTQLIDDAATIADRRFELGPIPSGQLTADPDRLAQALRNLLGNAVTHTAEHHGRVRLEAESLPHGELRITISDDGPGIPEDQLERIFDRFHRIRSRAAPPHGAGLGLSIVRAIVDAHGGRVGVGRADGGGARFDLILPGFLALPEVSAAPTATSPRS